MVLNDNEMSISENVGGLNNTWPGLMSGKLTTIREGAKVLAGLPPVKELAKRAEEHLKGMVVPGTLFEEFGFHYIGPIDGHDIRRPGRDPAQHAQPQRAPAATARQDQEGQG